MDKLLDMDDKTLGLLVLGALGIGCLIAYGFGHDTNNALSTIIGAIGGLVVGKK